jgi:hypothetical protein
LYNTSISRNYKFWQNEAKKPKFFNAAGENDESGGLSKAFLAASGAVAANKVDSARQMLMDAAWGLSLEPAEHRRRHVTDLAAAPRPAQGMLDAASRAMPSRCYKPPEGE